MSAIGNVETLQKEDRRQRRGLSWLLALLILGFAFSVMLGCYPGPYLTTIADLRNSEMARRLVWDLRLPRIIMAMLVGMGMSASGGVFQMVFRNPLVDSGFLGVTAGASFGASLAIVVLGGHAWQVQLCAAIFGFLSLGCSYAIGTRIRFGDWALRLVLAGIAVAALFTSGSGLLKTMAEPLRQLPELTYWLLGGLWSITWTDLFHILPITVPCLLILYFLRWRLNLLSMRDETAFSLGVAAGRERLVLLLAAVALTSAIVSKAGLIIWVGLIVPHLARKWLGSHAQRVLPGSIMLGGLFVLFCDDVARTLLPGEIPLGILTSSAGAIIFMAIMMRKSGQARQ
jgi:iron complex transport system permease protein